jgi:ATP-dependent Clp protease ATP-binding subunit ClpC
VLASLGVSHRHVHTAVLRMMGLGVESPGSELLFTAQAEDVIDRARREASIRSQPLVGTEHILLALIQEPNGAAARILVELDADPAAIRAALPS